MNLIAYSDSEGSDNEAPPVPKPAAKPAPKPSFQKVVDSANPGKIKINLPGASRPQAQKDDIDADAPPAKKARTGGGFGGFNSMLPAPKKAKANANVVQGDASGKRGLGKGLGAGVNLKTGAEPAFTRERKMYEDEDQAPKQKEDFRAMLNLPPPKTDTPAAAKPDTAEKTLASEPKPASKPKPRFVPMSVGRGKKRKPAAPRPAAVATTEASLSTSSPNTFLTTGSEISKPVAKPKISLFGMSQEEEAPTTSLPTGDYQPLLHGVGEDDDAEVPDEAFDEESAYQAPPPSLPLAGHGGLAQPQSLTNIATELNLSEAERRQLFGRKGRGGPDFSSANIVDFSTDTEYAHNEQLRQQGETVQHNALKSISGTGKNSLKSLISAATTQKDALEEHFAAGRRNKREAGSKYGW